MRHRKKGRKFGRVRKIRRALLKSLLRSLVLAGRIKTTEAKAKELRPEIEKLITRAKKNDMASRREIFKALADKKAVKKLFESIGPRYLDRRGGYTRIIKLGPRASDNARMAIIELL